MDYIWPTGELTNGWIYDCDSLFPAAIRRTDDCLDLTLERPVSAKNIIIMPVSTNFMGIFTANTPRKPAGVTADARQEKKAMVQPPGKQSPIQTIMT